MLILPSKMECVHFILGFPNIYEFLGVHKGKSYGPLGQSYFIPLARVSVNKAFPFIFKAFMPILNHTAVIPKAVKIFVFFYISPSVNGVYLWRRLSLWWDLPVFLQACHCPFVPVLTCLMNGAPEETVLSVSFKSPTSVFSASQHWHLSWFKITIMCIIVGKCSEKSASSSIYNKM